MFVLEMRKNLTVLLTICIFFQGTGAASFDEFGNSKYQNRRTMSSSDRAMMNAFKEITNMADRINLPRNIVVSSCLCLKLFWR